MTHFRTTLRLGVAGLAALYALASPAQEGMTRSPVDGLGIAWSVAGEGPVTVVLVHGWQCDRGYWREQVAYLADQYRVLLVDLPGHGASEGGRTHWSMAAFGEDLAAVVGETVTGPVVLVGHSMGGPVILEAAPRIDGLIGLVAVDTFRDALSPPPDEAALAAAMAPVEADYAGVVRAFIESMFVETTPPGLREEIITAMMAGDRDAGLGMMRGYARMDHASAFARLEVPVVVLNSGYRPTPEQGLRALHPLLVVEEIEGAGHFPMLEIPGRFNAHLDRILIRLVEGHVAGQSHGAAPGGVREQK